MFLGLKVLCIYSNIIYKMTPKMMRIDPTEMKEGKKYRFCARYDFANDCEDQMPHFYEGIFDGTFGRKGPWTCFRKFTDLQTKKTEPNKEIRFFGMKNLVEFGFFELEN